MASKNLLRETLQGLKMSKKGKIKFDPYWAERGEHILEGYKGDLGLSPNCAGVMDRLSSRPLKKSSFLCSSSGGCSPDSSAGSVSDINTINTTFSAATPLKNKRRHLASPLSCKAVSDEMNSETPEADVSKVSSPVSLPAISLLSSKAMQTAGCIDRIEKKHQEKAKSALRLRQEKLVVAVADAASEQLKRFEELMELKQKQEDQSMRDMRDRETKESMVRYEKLKEEQRHRMKNLNLSQKVAEPEQQQLWEAELERQTQVDGRERLQNLHTIQVEILQLNQLLRPSSQTKTDLPPTSISSYSTRGNQLCSQVSVVVRKTAEGQFPSVEDMTMAEQALHEMRALIQLMQEEVVKAHEWKKEEQEQEEKRRKMAALQAQQDVQKKAAQSAQQKAMKKGLQNTAEDSTLKWYKELQQTAAQCAQAIEQLSTTKDAQTKKLKQELQKAATIPVSQISSNSGSQLREIFDKIDKLLSGGAVVSGGKSVSVSQHPQGLDFVSYKLAEKFVKQGEEEVASHHEAAFPIAVVASGIWELHPRVGDLILACLHKKCPYAVPHYPPMKDGTPVEEYQKILGYRVGESGVEDQDSFLKRMSGMIRLYAAIIQMRWPYISKQGSLPHGLNHGWRWLAQMLNMEPLADITATLLLDFLEVCGNALMKQYQGQFFKLMLYLKEEYLPRIEAVTSSGQMGSVSRLQEFLETALQNQQISPPKGQLSSRFWRT
ncbi:nucleoporin GLE1-like [Parambassis ranga]|uniref:mRNA export factor GLE1 n=1 Tax=Parambassis ranga TaxID=210632 RepID=A0A6P7JXE9_9TELE|nr:nucleoporin GLE1-like [Parambassis ranga]